MSDRMMSHFLAVPQRRGGSGWNDFVAAVRLAWLTRTTRRALPDLSDHLLADIGLCRADALAEAARSPWDVHPVRR